MPSIGVRQVMTIQYLDHSGERKGIRLNAGEITPLTLEDWLEAFGDLQSALDAVTLGTRSLVGWGQEEVVSNTIAPSNAAQIETELLVLLQGETSEEPFSFRIPTADYTAFNFASPPAGDSVIISGAGASAATLALVAAIEAVAVNPEDSAEALVVVGMKVV